MSDDNALQREVIDELDRELKVNAAHIRVAAKDGVVTITGDIRRAPRSSWSSMPPAASTASRRWPMS